MGMRLENGEPPMLDARNRRLVVRSRTRRTAKFHGSGQGDRIETRRRPGGLWVPREELLDGVGAAGARLDVPADGLQLPGRQPAVDELLQLLRSAASDIFRHGTAPRESDCLPHVRLTQHAK